MTDSHFESICELVANIDDMTPELAGFALGRLMDAGALDAWWTSIVMKKGRPALQLQVLCRSGESARFIDLIESETTTLGVRVYEGIRSVLDRKIETVETRFGSIRMKVAYKADEFRNIAPEYEDCLRCAAQHGAPLKQVYQAALVAYYREKGWPDEP
jgi:pyridinium-3,5-bisthiocarboxylic acid mononucleotide nickel chelatase